jgi:hypothetical protein
MDKLAAVHVSPDRARFTLLLRLALDFTGRVTNDAPLASEPDWDCNVDGKSLGFTWLAHIYTISLVSL